MNTRAVFKTPNEPIDAIPFVLTPTERAFAAWVTVHLEKQRRERNKREAGNDVEHGESDDC
jgi:hypothetical protein